MHESVGIKLVPYDETFLDFSWKWLNDPELKHLTNTPEFTKEDQRRWFDSLENNPTYQIWGITYGGNPAGACGIKNITTNDCEYWGYIGDKNLWGKGLGKELLLLMEDKARQLEKTTIWLRVIKDNKRAVSLYKKNSYFTEKENDEEFIMRKNLW